MTTILESGEPLWKRRWWWWTIESVDNRHFTALASCLPFWDRPSHPRRSKTKPHPHLSGRLHRRSTDFEASSSSSPSSQPNIYPPQARDLVVTEQDSGKSRQVLLEKGVVEEYDRFTGQALRLIEADNPPLSNALAHEMPWVRPAFDGFLQFA
ncbi:uncharacterized protein PGTG_10857 [Puccinia graminis f. sp. tritici CRL 75-36-700-3]|uniref:Uncharacterized protein n=1 Tax=Puccinia graminis f. sp. tritici (strain CRL 75-36-700-3 / race SCCL) TaxID=418459 RepID=E3KK73_PUCGT|nr:uncharacterized protein PGTG_10857 [Puccinia graminis f. sp. tritici CRL 75-36-700-3]EFP84698.2 hypothetical protein PGTG_10857 [Puccinia graminis f. sp. tritici CRL 75-36-700-3]